MSAESVFDDTASRKLEAAYLTPDVVEQRHAPSGRLTFARGSACWMSARDRAC
jgi:hypothetical protein